MSPITLTVVESPVTGDWCLLLSNGFLLLSGQVTEFLKKRTDVFRLIWTNAMTFTNNSLWAGDLISRNPFDLSFSYIIIYFFFEDLRPRQP